VKLREWAAREGVHYQTAWRWWWDGRLPVQARQTVTSTILVGVLPSMCARLYGRRGARNRAIRAVTAAKHAKMDTAA
jgi:predicted site-specific integrase-resolvase